MSTMEVEQSKEGGSEHDSPTVSPPRPPAEKRKRVVSDEQKQVLKLRRKEAQLRKYASEIEALKATMGKTTPEPPVKKTHVELRSGEKRKTMEEKSTEKVPSPNETTPSKEEKQQQEPEEEEEDEEKLMKKLRALSKRSKKTKVAPKEQKPSDVVQSDDDGEEKKKKKNPRVSNGKRVQKKKVETPPENSSESSDQSSTPSPPTKRPKKNETNLEEDRTPQPPYLQLEPSPFDHLPFR